MLAWAQVVLLLLQILDKITGFAVKQGYIREGRDAAIAEAAMAIAQKVLTKQEIQRRLEGMSDAEVDDALRNRGA